MPAARPVRRLMMRMQLRWWHWGLLIAMRLVLLLLMPLLLLLVLPPAGAAVPNDRAVPAYAEEQTILQVEQGLPEPGLGSAASGREHLDRNTLVPPGRTPEYGVILQRGGNTWRVLRNGPFATGSAALLVGVLLLLALLHWRVGPDSPPGAVPDPRASLLRFTRWQRIVHWSTAIAFVVLALTGLLLLAGKKLVLPWLGHEVFAWLAIVAKLLHNIAGPLFVLLSLLMFVTYLRHNHFRRHDWAWLKQGGGLLTHRSPPAGYFNAGEKLWFWIAVTGLGLLMAATGLMLDFPYYGEVGAVAGLTRYQLQWANLLHIGGATLYLGAALGHIYLGTLGSPAAWQAMRHGRVSEDWARQHHRLWHDEVRQAGGAPDTAAASAAPLVRNPP